MTRRNSARPRILVTRRWPESVEALLAERFDAVLNEDDRPLSAERLRQSMREYDALCPCVTDRLDAGVLGVEGRRVQLIANYGVGYNHIDMEAAREAGLQVTNTPDVLTDATADLALTLMLMAARRAGEGERQLRGGQWTGWYPTHLMGAMVSGKTLGLVGMGRIGQATARRAHFGFGMRILYHNRRQLTPEALDGLPAGYCERLETLLEEADFVSLHCPAAPDTRHLIGPRMLARMKPSAFLINTARGDVVDEEALAGALRDGRIAGAGLDVYEREPRVAEALLGMENVVLLPHLGSAARETREAMGLRVLRNLEAFFAGQRPPDLL